MENVLFVYPFYDVSKGVFHMHENCLWVVVAPHLIFLFLILSYVSYCIGVSFVVGVWIWSVFGLVFVGFVVIFLGSGWGG